MSLNSPIQECFITISFSSEPIGEQKNYFHLWGLQKPLVAFATRDFFNHVALSYGEKLLYGIGTAVYIPVLGPVRIVFRNHRT
jgi:hypothetical protein